MCERPFFFPFNVYLIGFMGSGKTATALFLKSFLKARVLDTDEEIIRRSGKSIRHIFSIFGEERFRDLESAVIKEAAQKSGLIVSTGGGAVLREVNVTAMKKSGMIVYLKTSPKTVCERLTTDDKRPLLKESRDEAYIRALMQKRRKFYEEAAQITLITDGKSTKEICEEILFQIKRGWKSDV